jgi:hypothetical protein
LRTRKQEKGAAFLHHGLASEATHKRPLRGLRRRKKKGACGGSGIHGLAPEATDKRPLRGLRRSDNGRSGREKIGRLSGLLSPP